MILGIKICDRSKRDECIVWSENWVAHQIDDIIHFVSLMDLNKESTDYVMTTSSHTAADALHTQLLFMIENCDFYEAQNFLRQHMGTKSIQHLEVVIDFYTRLNQFDDRTLEKGNLIRDDLKTGLCFAIDAFGITIFS